MLLLALFIFAALFLLQQYLNKQEGNKKSVKAVIITPTLYITPTLIPILTPTPAPFVVLKKASYTIAIFGEYIAIFMWTEPMTATLTKSKQLSNSFKEYFNLMWKIAKK